MCKFSIDFLPERYKENEYIGQFGVITLGDFSEKFISSLCDWDEESYTKHWIKSSERILYDSDRTLFITSMIDNPFNYQLDCWIAYKIGEMVYIQNELIIPETYFISNGFNSENLYSYIRDREIYLDDSNQISEWVVPLKWIEDYYLRSKA
ncbi:hypothetical protein TUMEXPCC7403_25020 [Tumidithrix helvetica PCC 7403]|uniref:hypothetical protein n=1 Tax=Tumidithrix helvetica TaxID=3457545 RepID=UPI003C9CF91C